jgi:F0F1-type ATP synthase membrane subunit b/b'
MALTISLLVLVVILAYFAWRSSMEAAQTRVKYAAIIDIDKAVAAARQELERVRQEQRVAEQEHQRTRDAQLRAATEELDRVRRDQQAFLAAAQQE